MIDEHIEKIEAALRSGNISEEKRSELLGLLPKLKSAIAEVSQTHDKHAEKIARLVAASADDALRSVGQADSQRNVHGLKESVEGFEASHPQLFAAVNEYATILSSMGL